MVWDCLVMEEYLQPNLIYVALAYFMKMMDFKKGDWCNIMDGLYWRFIDRNRKFFLKNPRLSMMVRIFDKMKTDRKKLILSELQTNLLNKIQFSEKRKSSFKNLSCL